MTSTNKRLQLIANRMERFTGEGAVRRAVMAELRRDIIRALTPPSYKLPKKVR